MDDIAKFKDEFSSLSQCGVSRLLRQFVTVSDVASLSRSDSDFCFAFKNLGPTLEKVSVPLSCLLVCSSGVGSGLVVVVLYALLAFSKATVLSNGGVVVIH